MNFKVGDRVKCIKRLSLLHEKIQIGDEFVVYRIHHVSGNALGFKEILDGSPQWTSSQFVLVAPTPFKEVFIIQISYKEHKIKEEK